MDRLLISLFALISISSQSYAQDYYWVGGTGNWDEPEHWATTSGGSTFHSTEPDSLNDVYFDVNSFTEEGQICYIPDSSMCRSLISQGALYEPKLQHQGAYNSKFFVYGDLILSDEIDRSFKYLAMRGSGAISVDTDGRSLGGGTFFAMENDDMVVNLMDTLLTGNLYVTSGEFYSNDFPIDLNSRLYVFTDKTVDMGSSRIDIPLKLQVFESDLIDLSNTTIYFGYQSLANTRQFAGDDEDYGTVYFLGSVHINSSNSYQDFIGLPGSVIAFDAGSTQSASQFHLQGNIDSLVTLLSYETGSEFYLEQSAGTVAGQYLSLADCHAQGGATFNALDTYDQGNNSGWNISPLQPEEYFWVGGSGNWSDVNHWATASGGSDLHLSPPSQIDQVYFDENSFDADDAEVIIDVNSSCEDLDMSGIDQAISFSQNNSIVLNIYGSMWLSDQVTYSFDKIFFRSTEAEETISTADIDMGSQAELEFNGAALFSLEGNIIAREVYFTQGDFISNGNDITTNFSFDIYLVNGGHIDLSNSVITSKHYDGGYFSDITVDYSNSIVIVDGTLSGGYDTLATVIHSGEYAFVHGWTWCDTYQVVPGTNLSIQAGRHVTAENFDLNGTATEIITISSSSPGEEAFFYKSSGTVEASFLDITDNHAEGGATFNVSSGVLNDNVEGWNLHVSSVDEYSIEPLLIYPNPSNGSFSIPAGIEADFMIFDLSGRLIERFSSTGMSRDYTMELSSGSYLLQGLTEDKTFYQSSLIIE